MYVNVGAKHYQSGTDIATKSWLKKMAKENPDHVLIYTTSELSPKSERTLSNLDLGVKYTP